MTQALPVPPLHVRTTELQQRPQLIGLADPAHPLVVQRRGEGVVGLGRTLRWEFRGRRRFAEAAAAWASLIASATVDDAVGLPGTGLIAFGAFAFSPDSARPSVLEVPATVVGVREGRAFLTEISTEPFTAPPVAPRLRPYGAEYRITLLPGALDGEGYEAAVADAIGRITAGELEKVVLARDIVGKLPDGADLRRVLCDLALGYADCWTYAVDGLVGASPETLVEARAGIAHTRVLAGSSARGADAGEDQAAALALATSSKDQDEHRFAVQSALTALRARAATVTVSEQPFALKLPNLWHLASDIEAELEPGTTALDLVAALHPTAAVAGSPTDVATAVIAELEPSDRGRYAGPVGWVGAHGDGEWAIALRGAQVDDDGRITAHAGAGIVAGSNPVQERAETAMKFRPIADAFA
ncbi:MAG: isochorismate synthase [Microbacteriaceae bacterium]